MSVILATGGYDHKIRFWEAPSGVCHRTLRFPDSQITSLQITPDKQFLAAGGNPHLRLYEINAGNDDPILTLEGHTSTVTCLGFQRDGRYLYSAGEDGTIKLWDLRSRTYSRSLENTTATNHTNNGSQKRSTNNAACIPISSVALRNEYDQIVSGDHSGHVKIWDLSMGKCINAVKPAANTTTKGFIQSVDISDDDQTLVAYSNHAMVYVWNPKGDITSLQPVTKFCAHPSTDATAYSYGLHASISPDSRSLVTTSSDQTVKLWDTTSWECRSTLQSHTKWVWDAAFCADSSYLVTASSDHTARLWNLRSGDVVRQYNGHPSAVTCVALNDSSV
mmetsp:Transcript_9220/g.14272  ORF Transcript_9220/g.14272 Transcript_9220/m.14272 type:complete len:334 (+) Transcript_9220:205-1206(+)|eukprot:CAMPEP_0194256134 /NCGR_PEP_ID=MMETSP0158-20130606/36092_1 /TAXON_ID=33649 /ORGANISM="Thalassionema nitzschioides, Strain L26-B" /LENGTH=333 /DNA_ID=CAMNT_0038994727 /DNA_START=151 /DNA_END=1152 /DNA_ORIENTATION=+